MDNFNPSLTASEEDEDHLVNVEDPMQAGGSQDRSYNFYDGSWRNSEKLRAEEKQNTNWNGGNSSNWVGWFHTIREIKAVYQKYGDILPPLEELGEWSIANKSEYCDFNPTKDAEDALPKVPLNNGPNSYWDP